MSASEPRLGTVLAFDFGERRTGVAVGDLSMRIAHPVTTLHAASAQERMRQIVPLVKEWNPVLMVVGLPTHADGTIHARAQRCRSFARQLESRFGVETRLVDEYLSSIEADRSLAEAGVRGLERKAMVDQVAAQQILETFFSLHGDGIA
ncbi:MAG: Holliday junction resolvase RuvX [Proteobacteria bacterium]|nr:MAG: Holliday junction resolvase RuvX [Pseudomonadota bacterium]